MTAELEYASAAIFCGCGNTSMFSEKAKVKAGTSEDGIV